MSSHNEVNDLRYLFRLFYKQTPGFLSIYQNLRYYSDEHLQDLKYQETFDNLAEMKHRILAKVENNDH